MSGIACPVNGPGRTANLRCEVITHFDRLEELSAEWDRLWQSDSEAEIFQSFTWARTWWSCFGAGEQLCTPVVHEGDRVVLILPLVQREGTIRFLGAPQADYCDVLCVEDRTAELLALALNALLQSVPGWKECVFQDLSPHGRIARHWRELPPRLRSLLRVALSNYCPTILFEGKRNEIIDHLLAKKHLRRKQKKLSKAGLLSFRHLETKAEAQGHLTQFFQCQKRRCALLAKTSAFESPQMCSFFRALVEQLDLRNEMRLGALELNGRPVAWSLGFQVNGKFAFYQQTFDVDEGDFAPGEVLLYYLLLYAREKVERELDFARGDEFFKSRFATHTFQSWNLYFQRRNISGLFRSIWWAGRGGLLRTSGPIISVIRRHEFAFRFFRFMRIWRRRTSSRILQAKQSASLFKHLLGGVVNLLRTAFWSREEVTLYQIESGTAVEKETAGHSSDSALQVVAGRFSDLVDLLLEHPGVSPMAVEEGRNRLKKGDQPYVIRERERISVIAWTGTRNLVDLVSLNPDHRITFARPALTVYECWRVPGLDRTLAYRRLLLFLASEAEAQGKNLFICCSALQPLLRTELDAQDYWPKYRIIRRKFLHWIRHDSIRALPIKSWRFGLRQFPSQI